MRKATRSERRRVPEVIRIWQQLALSDPEDAELQLNWPLPTTIWVSAPSTGDLQAL